MISTGHPCDQETTYGLGNMVPYEVVLLEVFLREDLACYKNESLTFDGHELARS